MTFSSTGPVKCFKSRYFGSISGTLKVYNHFKIYSSATYCMYLKAGFPQVGFAQFGTDMEQEDILVLMLKVGQGNISIFIIIVRGYIYR